MLKILSNAKNMPSRGKVQPVARRQATSMESCGSCSELWAKLKVRDSITFCRRLRTENTCSCLVCFQRNNIFSVPKQICLVLRAGQKNVFKSGFDIPGTCVSVLIPYITEYHLIFYK